MKTKLFLTLWLLSLTVSVALAQTATATPTTTTTDTSSQSTVQYYFVACDTKAVIDLSGVMQAGYDVYVQVFRSSTATTTTATGTALTSLLRVPVSGSYTVSPDVLYINSELLATGQFAVAQISIASESNPSNTIYTDTVSDVQDGCDSPQYSSVATSTATGTIGTTGTTTGVTIDPATGLPVASGTALGIYTPDGGIYYPPAGITPREDEPAVFIGARPSELQDTRNFEGRSSKPGYIFAECDKYDRAAPGTIYDNDRLIVFWSWYATTPELAQQHIDNAIYDVYLSSDYNGPQYFQYLDISPITRREDGRYWVFYSANLGDGFRQGQYHVSFKLRWKQTISDGISQYGPNTNTTLIQSTCYFNVQNNPWGIPTNQNNPTLPLQADVFKNQ